MSCSSKRDEGCSESILFVGYLLHPVDRLAVEFLRDCDVGHGCTGRSTMPMLLTWSKPNHIPGANLFNGSAYTLRPSAARRHDERLTEWMSVPCRASTRLKRDNGSSDTCGIGSLKWLIDAYCACEPIRWAFIGWLRTVAFDFHTRSISTVMKHYYGLEGAFSAKTSFER